MMSVNRLGMLKKIIQLSNGQFLYVSVFFYFIGQYKN